MLSWHGFRDGQPVFSMKLTMGDQYGGCLYLNIQHYGRSQTMNGEAETEAADLHDEKLNLWRPTARLMIH